MLEKALVRPLAMVPAVVGALTVARTVGWSFWWSPVCHFGAAASGQPPGRLSLDHRHVSLRRLSEVCPSCLQLARFELEIWYIIPFTLRIWQSRSLCVGVACGVQHWIFREILQLLVGAILGIDSGYMFSISTWRLDELLTFSTLRQTRILKCCCPFFVDWRSVLSRCF